MLQGIYKVSKDGKVEVFLGEASQPIIWVISQETGTYNHHVRQLLEAREWIETETARYCACSEAGMPLAYGWGDDEHLAGWQEEGHDRPDYAKSNLPEDYELEARRHEAGYRI
jgi:hypothetical protein